MQKKEKRQQTSILSFVRGKRRKNGPARLKGTPPIANAKKRANGSSCWKSLCEDCTLVDIGGPHGEHAMVRYYPLYLNADQANTLYDQLESHRDIMSRDEVLMHGKRVLTPRLTVAFGTDGTSYTYSHMTRRSVAWGICPLLNVLKKKLELELGQPLNYALVQRYADGSDYIGWHSDAEDDMVENSWIASVTLGNERDFQFRRRGTKAGPILELSPIQHGSLLLMNMDTQKMYKHSLPKRAGIEAPRINITFRHMKGL